MKASKPAGHSQFSHTMIRVSNGTLWKAQSKSESMSCVQHAPGDKPDEVIKSRSERNARRTRAATLEPDGVRGECKPLTNVDLTRLQHLMTYDMSRSLLNIS